MIKFVIALAFISALPAFAARKAGSPMTQETESSDLKHSLGIDMSINRGGLSAGVDYEYALRETIGIGGYLRFFSKNNDSGSAYANANGMIFFGFQGVAHYRQEKLDFYLAPGFGFDSIDPYSAAQKSVFTMGPRLAFGLLYQVNNSIAFGFEHSNYYCWFASDWNGLLIDDLAFKFRATF